MCFSHLGVFLISVKPLTTENTENKTTSKICKITVCLFAPTQMFLDRRVATYRKLRKVSSRVPKKKKKISEKEKERKETKQKKKRPAQFVKKEDDPPENATCHC